MKQLSGLIKENETDHKKRTESSEFCHKKDLLRSTSKREKGNWRSDEWGLYQKYSFHPYNKILPLNFIFGEYTLILVFNLSVPYKMLLLPPYQSGVVTWRRIKEVCFNLAIFFSISHDIMLLYFQFPKLPFLYENRLAVFISSSFSCISFFVYFFYFCLFSVLCVWQFDSS